MNLRISAQSAKIATVAAGLLFVILFLAWPVDYMYVGGLYSCPAPPGISLYHSCPAGVLGKDGRDHFLTPGKGPIISSLFKNKINFRYRVRFEYVARKDLLYSFIGWLVVYELVDISPRHNKNAKSVKLSKTNHR